MAAGRRASARMRGPAGGALEEAAAAMARAGVGGRHRCARDALDMRSGWTRTSWQTGATSLGGAAALPEAFIGANAYPRPHAAAPPFGSEILELVFGAGRSARRVRRRVRHKRLGFLTRSEMCALSAASTHQAFLLRRFAMREAGCAQEQGAAAPLRADRVRQRAPAEVRPQAPDVDENPSRHHSTTKRSAPCHSWASSPPGRSSCALRC